MNRTTAVNTAKTVFVTAIDITEFTALALASLVVTALGLFYTGVVALAWNNLIATGPTAMEAVAGVAVTVAAFALVGIGLRIGSELTTTHLYQTVRS